MQTAVGQNWWTGTFCLVRFLMSANQQLVAKDVADRINAVLQPMTDEQILEVTMAAGYAQVGAVYVQWRRKEQEARAMQETRGEEQIEESAPSTPDKRIGGGNEPRSAPGAPRCNRYA